MSRKPGAIQSRVVEPTGRLSHQRWFNKISQKSLDFVVCAKDSSVIAVIELDDASHGAKHRQRSDQDKDAALEDAKVAVLRWTVDKLPTVEAIKQAFTIPEN